MLDKKNNKWKNIFNIASFVRKKKYDSVVNLHRFGSSGFITWCSGAKEKIGFDKNPCSFFYTKKIRHEIGNGTHEIERNHKLIELFTDKTPAKPNLYPSEKDFEAVKKYSHDKYICIAPASVWFTKQFPKEKWIELIGSVEKNMGVYLIGSSSDYMLCDEIRSRTNELPGWTYQKSNVENLSGKLSILQTAALMKNAQMNYVNDSAPAHIASAMNAPVTVIFCSTIPVFGFGPLSSNSKIVETKEKLNCRPCGLHGYHECPKEHFKCATAIDIKEILT